MSLLCIVVFQDKAITLRVNIIRIIILTKADVLTPERIVITEIRCS